jgi:hypothetical protein
VLQLASILSHLPKIDFLSPWFGWVSSQASLIQSTDYSPASKVNQVLE